MILKLFLFFVRISLYKLEYLQHLWRIFIAIYNCLLCPHQLTFKFLNKLFCWIIIIVDKAFVLFHENLPLAWQKVCNLRQKISLIVCVQTCCGLLLEFGQKAIRLFFYKPFLPKPSCD